MLGERGSTDTARDVRGFAVKFYTDEGNWDLVGNNIPIFFIQDAMKFPDLVHAAKPEPHFGMPQAASAHDTFWDFASLMPEITAMLMWAMSDRAIPRSYRMMQGFGVHTYRLVNEAGESHFVKFHWTPAAGTHSLVWDEAVKISGADSDFHRRDLWEAIEAGAWPEWELGLQIFTEEQAEGFTFDVLDATKIVPEELVPIVPVGKLVLNRNPDNFFAETEQVAFCVAHVVPGIDFSNDPLLAGRIHSYVDTQISRLGGAELPRDSDQRAARRRSTTISATACIDRRIHRGRVSYEPNSLGGGCPFQAGAAGFVVVRRTAGAGRHTRCAARPSASPITTRQATLFWNSQTPVEKTHIINAFRFELSKVQDAGHPRAHGLGADERRDGAGDGRGRRSRHPQHAAADAEGAGARACARGDDVADAVAVRASGRRRHSDATRRDPGGRRRRRNRAARAQRTADRRRRRPAVRRPRLGSVETQRGPDRGRREHGSGACRALRRGGRRRMARARCAPSRATATRWSSSGTSIGTASRSSSSATASPFSRRPAFPLALPSGEPIPG